MAQVVFLSDAHLGSGPDSLQREKELCSFLDGIKDDCHMLFLLGDMFDFWFTYRHTVPRGHTRLLGKLAELSDKGVELHFFIGNHDMWMFDYLEKEMDAVMHDEPEVMEIDGRRFLIGHGDGLGHLDHSYDFLRRIFRSRLNQWLFALLPPSWTFPFARRWSDSNKLKHARKNTLHYLGDDREGIVLYCKQRMEKEHFDYCVFGHRHTPLVKVLSEQCSVLSKVLSEQCSVLSKATQSGGNPLNTKHLTLNTEHLTLNTEHLTLNTEHLTLNTEHLTLNTVYVNTGDWMINRNYAVYSLGDHTLRLYDLNGGEVINQQE